jgi:drug/metabolite transporter (DMT)-like permease
MPDSRLQTADYRLPTTPRVRRGEPWALGSATGYALANLFDRVAVTHADPLIGPLLRGLPSLLLGMALVWKNRTLTQLVPNSRDYVGTRVLLSLLGAGAVSTAGLFAYYFAIRMGGVTITIPVLQTYGLWGMLIAWFWLRERAGRMLVLGLGMIALGLAALSFGQLHGQPISPRWYWAIPLALLAAATYGLAGALWRDAQLRGAHQSTAILTQFMASMTVALATLAANGRLALLRTAPRSDLVALLLSGILSGIVGIYCIFMALRLMTVARVFAFSALTPFLATLGAYFLLHEYLNALMLAGVCLASVGVALTQIFRPAQEKQV